MELKNIFKDIYSGRDIEITTNDGLYAYGLKTSNLDECVISTSQSNLELFEANIKDKYILRENDIIIASTKSSTTSHVGFASSIPNYPVIIGKNLIVLRNIYEEYEPLFIAEYLERFGIKKLFEEKGESYTRLSTEDIKSIDIPKVDIDVQRKLVELFKLINERTRLYKKNIVNDSKIIEELINQALYDTKKKSNESEMKDDEN